MARICIVSEFNPLHNGHLYLINKARELGADSVTCIMSGNATQRGELSITDKYSRAEAAIRCGADLVLELPYPWCSASAEYFAMAAISLVYPFGDTLLFGSECGDIKLLKRAAEVCDDHDFLSEYEKRITDGEGTASAYLKCLEERGFASFSSNDLLGIAYIRAINKLGVSLEPMTVTRKGAAYREKEELQGEYQSATALRTLVLEKGVDAIRKYVPSAMADIMEKQLEAGDITDIRNIDTALICYFRLADPSALSSVAEMSDGLENRICAIAKESRTFDEMFERLRTKRYTDAKLKRACLFALTSVTKSDIRTLPEYTLLLGANAMGRELLANNRKEQSVSVVTKPADAPRDTVQYKAGEKLDALYGLARENKLRSDAFIIKGAYIEK
jgi:cytidyltransferase-like protein